MFKGFQKPKRLVANTETLTERYGMFTAQPFQRGFGTTIGNSLRRVYGVLERQFRITFEKAALQKGITGENLMQNLERRLDSVIFRMGFGTSRAQARQVVSHGHIDVNGRKCNIPSAMVKVGDVISVRESSKANATILAARDATAHAPAPNWIDVDREGLKGRVQSLPKREDLVQIQLNEQLIVELYSK